MGKGGRGAGNVPKLKGVPASGSRPAGSPAVVPNGQYPTVLGTKKLPTHTDPTVSQPGPQINESGETTVNSTPAKS